MAHDVNQSEEDVAAQVRSVLVARISEERVDLWMPESTQWSVRENDNQLWLTFESDFASQLAQNMLKSDLTEAFKEVIRDSQGDTAAQQCEVHFEVAKCAPQAPLSQQPSTTAPTARPSVASHPRERNKLVATEVDHLAEFVQGESNQLAVAAAKMVVAEPGTITPVFIHGPNGSGKTLLASAIAQQLRGVQRLPRVIQMTSEQFLNDFTDGLRGGGLPMFRRKYRDVEALIVEDIQFFLGKKSSVTELKNTLDNLLRTGKQAVFTADRSLNELSALGSELIGRLRGGLSVPLFPLDYSVRRQVFESEIQSTKIDLDKSVVEELAKRSTGDGRVMSGIVKRLKAVSMLRGKKLDWDACWSAISDLVQATQPVVRISDIEKVVCDVFGLEPMSLRSPSKMRRISQPRMLAMFLARKYTPAAYKEIGGYFGRRRHSTVISAEKTVNTWLEENSDLDLGRGITVRDAIRHVESQLQVG